MSRLNLQSTVLICWAIVSLLLSACAITDIPVTPTLSNPISIPLGHAGNPVTRNADWQPVTRDFDGVEMVMVPVGCFNMGSDRGDADERPVETQCFSQPFWLDRYEVTNEQFARFGGQASVESAWTRPTQPRANLRWTEALAYCQLRSARLPTEREWEYAARGPDGLTYPWGNAWQPANLIFPDTAAGEPANVGTIPAGVSWVGAFDMAGNLWEWTSTLYDGFTYPYSASDGRDNLDDRSSQRTVRGGSWYDASDYYGRAANRGRNGATIQDFHIGVRCARDF